MAMKSSVMTMNGRIVSETRNGVRHFHAHDQLGNTIALYDDSGTMTDSYTYWPYGEVRARTGTTVNPFQFCGAWGYYKDSTGRTYVRARTLRTDLTRWSRIDKYWPKEHAYQYANADPISFADYMGTCPGSRPQGGPSPSGRMDPCQSCNVCDNGPVPCGALYYGLALELCASRDLSFKSAWASGPGYLCCCVNCWCPCNEMGGDGCKPGQSEADCAKETIEDFLGGDKVNGRPKVSKADCGQCSEGKHYQWECSPRKGYGKGRVITSRCCKCQSGNNFFMKCETTRGCHSN